MCWRWPGSAVHFTLFYWKWFCVCTISNCFMCAWQSTDVINDCTIIIIIIEKVTALWTSWKMSCIIIIWLVGVSSWLYNYNESTLTNYHKQISNCVERHCLFVCMYKLVIYSWKRNCTLPLLVGIWPLKIPEPSSESNRCINISWVGIQVTA